MKFLINGFNQSSVVLLQFHLAVQFHMCIRVATDLKNLEKSGNLKETSESQRISLKVREFGTEFKKSRESQRILLSEVHFQSN